MHSVQRAMAAERDFAALVERIGRYRITEKAMRRVQADAQAAVAEGAADAKLRGRYLAAARRYFQAFNGEARAQLRDIDHRLEAVAQVQFNLGAERSVAVKRIEGTSDVLEELDRLAEDEK